ITRRFFPFRFRWQSFTGPLSISGRFEKTDVRNRFVFFTRCGMEAAEVSNHPLAVVQFPVHRRAPLFAVDCCPSFRKPPAEVLITAVVDEFEKVAVADWSFVERVVLEEDLMPRLLIIECEVVRTVRARAVVTNSKKSTLNLSHAFN